MKEDEFVTADLHFGHKAMLTLGDRARQFATTEEMDANIIERWNAKVPTTAVVYLLGDISYRKNEDTSILLGQLNGRIRVVRGNHDKKSTKRALKERCEWVRDYYESTTNAGIKVCMFHYPCITWNKCYYGSWHLHGHCHGNLIEAAVRRMDVGIECHPNGLEPFSYEEVFDYMQGKGFQVVDHHENKS